MRILEENWKVLTSFFPTGWRQMARQGSGGKVAQPTTSIGTTACLVNIASRPTDRNVRLEVDLKCESWPVLASNFRVAHRSGVMR